MELPEYPAISVLCRIVSDLPKTARRTALGFLCNALGRPAEPTGIPLSADRPVGHMYWDHEIDDLYDRLVELVEDVGLEEQLAVQGATTYITTHFGLWADPTFSKLNVEGFRTSIDRLSTQAKLPIERRDGRQSDDEINTFIKRLSELIESSETRRQEAEDTHKRLASEFETAFSYQFWEALKHVKFTRSKPELDELLNGEEDDSEE